MRHHLAVAVLACAYVILTSAFEFGRDPALIDNSAKDYQSHAKNELGSQLAAEPGASARIAHNVQAAKTSAKAPLAFLERPALTKLARLDPLTLEPVGPYVPIGEYHWAATTSPDGLRLAVATGGPGGGIQIIDLERMETAHSVHTGIAAEALAWLTPNRLLGALQCNPTNSGGRGCGIVLVDGGNGKILRRWPETERNAEFLPFRPPSSPPKPVATTRHGAVFLPGNCSEIASARLARI